ncbi:MAG: hypothetical protein PHU78_07215 [Heliobacteriaceae bacterium]|nr:hypothetical protein [Heliobacteriaceae bacterium]
MLNFEKRYFDTCWQSKPKIMSRLIQKDPMMFRLCKVKKQLKGYYGIIPLSYDVWRKVLKGQINEDEAMAYVQPFVAPETYLYIYSVIVDLADPKHKVYTRALVHDLTRQYILGLNRKKADIRAVGAFTVSEGGRRLVERSNFIYNGSFRGKNGKYVRSYVRKTQ